MSETTCRLVQILYLVPDEFERKLVEALTEENIFRQLATVIKTSSGDRKIPIVTSKGEAAWMDEEDAYKLSDDTFGQASLGAYKVGTAIKISEELLNDAAFDLPSYIAKNLQGRIGAKEEEAFFIGDGKASRLVSLLQRAVQRAEQLPVLQISLSMMFWNCSIL